MRARMLGSVGLFASCASAFAGSEVTLEGVVRDIADEPVPGILIHFSSGKESGTTRSAEDGSYSIDVPLTGEPWTVLVDETELLGLGYFCLPGFIFDPGVKPIDPIVIVPELTTVPLRPDLTLERTPDGVTCVRLSFDWATGLVPQVLREYKIERSTDMVRWSEVMNISLACPPIEFFDETVGDEEKCHYRAVLNETFIVEELEPGDFEFIADPVLGGAPGELVFVEGAPLPESPIVAPEIRLVEPE